MIPVTPEPEPPNFDGDVRRPGQRYLRRVPNPSSDQFRKHDDWKKALPALRTAYRDICAYCGCWIPFDQGTVDHFRPKSVAPALAYEWSNFRLSQEKVNNYKDNSEEVLDPFHIGHGWFVLDLSTAYVKPNINLSRPVEEAVRKTIRILRLNSTALVKTRYSVLKDYSDYVTQIEFLDRRYPFIAQELRRQGRTESIKGTVR